MEQLWKQEEEVEAGGKNGHRLLSRLKNSSLSSKSRNKIKKSRQSGRAKSLTLIEEGTFGLENLFFRRRVKAIHDIVSLDAFFFFLGCNVKEKAGGERWGKKHKARRKEQGEAIFIKEGAQIAIVAVVVLSSRGPGCCLPVGCSQGHFFKFIAHSNLMLGG